MNFIETHEMDLIRVGDECTFAAYQAYNPGYSITTEKSYPGIVTEVYGDNFVNCKFTNDAGEEVEHGHQSGGFSGDGNQITVKLTPEVYKYRVLEANAKHVAIAEKEYQARLDRIKTYCDGRLAKLTPTE